MPDNIDFEQAVRDDALAQIGELISQLSPDTHDLTTRAIHMLADNEPWIDASRLSAFLVQIKKATGMTLAFINGGIRNRRREAAANRVKSGDFERANDGSIHASTLTNAKRAMDKLGVKARHDTFADRSLITMPNHKEVHVDDAELDALWLLVEERFGFRPEHSFFQRFISTMARQSSFHPVLDHIDALKWDNTPRLAKWIETYGKAVDHPEISAGGKSYLEYVRAVGRLALIAAVRRLRQPGCKFDEMLVFVSETQGLERSTALATLAIKTEWFSDSLDVGADDKKTIEQLRGKWIVEMPELKGVKKNEVESVKAFLSKTVDRSRLSYDRLRTEVPRQCVFFGTTNDKKFLKDKTGNRRFWPILGAKFDIEALKRDVEQLWAEAAHYERKEESIRLDKAYWPIAAVVQGESLEVEPWEDLLADQLDRNPTGYIRASDVWQLLGYSDGRGRTGHDNSRIGDAMKALGWERKQKKDKQLGPNPVWAYFKGTEEEQKLRIWVIANQDLSGKKVTSYRYDTIDPPELGADDKDVQE